MGDVSNRADEVYRFDITTDPDDPVIRNSLDNLLSIVDNNENFILTETNLDRGLVNYTIDTIYDADQNPDLIDQVDQLVGEVSYIPITVTMDIGRYIENPNVGSVITGAEEIIKVLTEKLLKVDVINVESMTRDGNIIVFTPITYQQDSVYENPLYLAEYYRIVNMDILGGYQVLSSNPMVKYVLNELYQNKDYVPTDINAIYVQGVALIPVGHDDEAEDHYRRIKDRVDTIITTKCQDGYFVYKLGIHNLSDSLLLRELSMLWETEIVYRDDVVIVLKKGQGVEFGTEPSLWFRYNLEIIKNGHFPSITLYGLWQFDVGGDYNEVYNKQWYQVIIQYGALLAYRKLGMEDPFIQSFTHTVMVNNDLSITLSLPTYSHVRRFLEYFDDILNGYRGLEHNGEQTWFVEPCKDLEDGVVKRWYVQGIDKRSMPMVLKNTYEDGRSDEVLVFRSPAVALYYPDSPLDFDNVDMDKVRLDLIDHLKEYYKLCHGEIETVLLDRIDQMDLVALLDLVEVRERHNEPTYCYSKNTLLNLTQPINPMTRRPFKDDVLIKAMLMEWGVRGLFNIGPLIGLYEDMPSKILVEPKAGHPLINKVIIDPLMRNITGDVYMVSVGFSDGTVNDMFEIATENHSEVKRLVEHLWNSGFFLNYWVSAVQKYSDSMNSFVIIIINPLLINGDNSKSDGIRAMDYLSEASNSL